MGKWLPDGEPLPDGTVGGDGAGEAVSVRFLNPDHPHACITSYWYVVDTVDRGWIDEDDAESGRGRYDVENMTELRIEDDQEREVWTDYEYENPSYVFFQTEAEAEAYRDRMAANDAADNLGLYYHWNGEPR